MVRRYTTIIILASLLAACGGSKEPKTGQELIDMVTIPPGWSVTLQGELDQSDIPADARTGLQTSFREVASEPLQKEGSVPTVYVIVLAYEDSAAARAAYEQIKNYRVSENAEIGDTQGAFPDEEVTFALTNREATATEPASALLQTTVLSCRAVVRFNWALYLESFTTNDATQLELNSVRQIREATCDGK